MKEEIKPRDIDTAIEWAVARVNVRYPGWSPSHAMLGYARAVAKAAIEAERAA